MPRLDWFLRVARRSPLLWGALASVAFYAALHGSQQWLDPLLVRCLAGRWEAYLCTSLFFVGLASLAFKAFELAQQSIWLGRTMLGARAGEPAGGSARALVEQLDARPQSEQQTYFVRRLRDALQFVLRKSEGDSLENHLRYLADVDAARMHASYALPRFLSWAIPAIGSLGTVLGIAHAVARLSLAPPAEPLSGVTEGLAIAFDTTALALSLSVILMFVKFICEQRESQLLTDVEVRVQQELTAKLAGAVTPRTSHVEQLRKLTESIVEANQHRATSQVGVAHETAAAGEQLEAIVSRAVANAISGQPVGPTAGVPAGAPIGDLSQVQQALQQIAAFFAEQRAEQIQENEVFKQLAELAYKSSGNWSPKKPAPDRRPEAEEESVVGLWNSLAE